MMLSTLRLSNIFLSAISFQDDIDYIGKIIKTEGLVLIIGAGPFFNSSLIIRVSSSVFQFLVSKTM